MWSDLRLGKITWQLRGKCPGGEGGRGRWEARGGKV